MKKILLAVDALDFRVNALDFAAYIAKLTKSQVIGVFLENLIPETKPDESNVIVNSENTALEVEDDEQQIIIERNIKLFIDGCISREVNGIVHLDMGVPINEMIIESRYADLLIMAPSTSFKNNPDGIPSQFIKDMLADAECPVIIAPENFNGIDTIIFTYNGSKSSVFAIKHFTYLFPELTNKEAIIIHIDKKDDWNSEEKHKIEDWLKPHYPNMTFAMLNGDMKEELFHYLLGKKNALVVMGAYGRTAVSNFFQHSNAEFLIKALNLPFFITHY